jgi:hypothetical protein
MYSEKTRTRKGRTKLEGLDFQLDEKPFITSRYSAFEAITFRGHRQYKHAGREEPAICAVSRWRGNMFSSAGASTGVQQSLTIARPRTAHDDASTSAPREQGRGGIQSSIPEEQQQYYDNEALPVSNQEQFNMALKSESPKWIQGFFAWISQGSSHRQARKSLAGEMLFEETRQ